MPSDDTIRRARSEWLLYSILLLSGGFLSFVWAAMLMHDVNRFERRLVYPLKALAIFLALLLLLYFGLLLSAETFAAIGFKSFPARFVGLFALGTILLGVLVAILVLVYRHANLGLGKIFTVLDIVSLVGLTLLVMLSFVIVQRRANDFLATR